MLRPTSPPKAPRTAVLAAAMATVDVGTSPSHTETSVLRTPEMSPVCNLRHVVTNDHHDYLPNRTCDCPLDQSVASHGVELR